MTADAIRSALGGAVRCKVLVVDDAEGSRALIEGQLRRALPDVEVLGVASGAEALALARSHEFAAVVVDVHMPDMDGYEVTSLLRHEGCAAPVLLLSPQAATEAEMLRGYRMGAADYLIGEPQRNEILLLKLRASIRACALRQALRAERDGARSDNRVLQSRLDAVSRERSAMEHEVVHDRLTGLPNRRLFEDRVELAIKRGQRLQRRAAFAFVDLDGFKAINDAHGHATGDALMVNVARRLTGALRAIDTVARIGGDEFGIVFEQLDSAEAAEYLGRKIHRLITEPMVLRSAAENRDVEIRPGASIGISICPDHADGRVRLLNLADLTMYAAKRAGGGARLYSGVPAAHSVPDVAGDAAVDPAPGAS